MTSEGWNNTNKAYRIIIMLAFLAHIIFMLIFGLNGMPGFVFYNLASALFHFIMAILVYKGHLRLITALVHVEICIFVVVCTVMLGDAYEFTAYLIAMPSLMYFNPFKRKHVIFLFSVSEFLLFFLLKVWALFMLPIVETQETLQITFSYLNYVSCFVVILVGTLVSKVATERLEKENYQMTRDELTGIYNRKYFLEKVSEVLKKNNKQYYLMCTNISGFKFYNELFGAERGDQVLIEQAQMMRSTSQLHGTYGRLSGDEFGMLVPEEAYDKDAILKYTLALQEKFSSPLYHMHIYVGIYKVTDHNEPSAAMCEKARIAIDEIKGNYDRHFAYYDEKLLQESMIKRRVIGEFDHALETNQFCIYLQPQVVEQGKVLGAEALVRWIHPEDGLIPPGKFIPVLEETGLISRLDQFVWEQAAQLLQKWKQEGKDDIYISVNVSAKDFYHVNIYEAFTGLVEKYQIHPANLKIEITETVLMNEAQNQLELLQKLRDYGFEIEIDDFGSGYSSLNMLKDIMVDVMKIDMGFLEKTEHEERSWNIIQIIVSLAKTLGMRTVTEGVETEEQVKKLALIGCEVFQGYYFAKPMPVENFINLYMEE